jgi:hypothetical protein
VSIRNRLAPELSYVLREPFPRICVTLHARVSTALTRCSSGVPTRTFTLCRVIGAGGQSVFYRRISP